MRDPANLATMLQSFFTTRLMAQRKASPHTIASYRDTFRLLLHFAQKRLRKAPSQLGLDDLDASLVGAFLEDLVGEHAQQHDGSHDGVVERTGNPQEVHQILQHLKERGADDDADDRTFTAAQTASAQHGGGDAVKLIEVSMVRGRDRVGVERDHDARNPSQHSSDHIAAGDDPSCVDT